MRAKAAIAALALALAACGGAGDDTGAAEAADADLAVTGTDAFEFVPNELEASAGETSIALTCQQALQHDLVVATETEDITVAECGGGETSVGTIDLEAGTYTFYCSIPGHRQAGMEGTLTVG